MKKSLSKVTFFIKLIDLYHSFVIATFLKENHFTPKIQ